MQLLPSRDQSKGRKELLFDSCRFTASRRLSSAPAPRPPPPHHPSPNPSLSRLSANPLNPLSLTNSSAFIQPSPFCPQRNQPQTKDPETLRRNLQFPLNFLQESLPSRLSPSSSSDSTCPISPPLSPFPRETQIKLKDEANMKERRRMLKSSRM